MAHPSPLWPHLPGGTITNLILSAASTSSESEEDDERHDRARAGKRGKGQNRAPTTPQLGPCVMRVSRKPNVSPNGRHTGRWTRAEHELFLEGLQLYGREWKKVSAKIKTRTAAQIRSHAQKYFAKIGKDIGKEDATPLEGAVSSSSRRRVRSGSDDGSLAAGLKCYNGCGGVETGDIDNRHLMRRPFSPVVSELNPPYHRNVVDLPGREGSVRKSTSPLLQQVDSRNLFSTGTGRSFEDITSRDSGMVVGPPGASARERLTNEVRWIEDNMSRQVCQRLALANDISRVTAESNKPKSNVEAKEGGGGAALKDWSPTKLQQEDQTPESVSSAAAHAKCANLFQQIRVVDCQLLQLYDMTARLRLFDLHKHTKACGCPSALQYGCCGFPGNFLRRLTQLRTTEAEAEKAQQQALMTAAGGVAGTELVGAAGLTALATAKVKDVVNAHAGLLLDQSRCPVVAARVQSQQMQQLRGTKRSRADTGWGGASGGSLSSGLPLQLQKQRKQQQGGGAGNKGNMAVEGQRPSGAGNARRRRNMQDMQGRWEESIVATAHAGSMGVVMSAGEMLQERRARSKSMEQSTEEFIRDNCAGVGELESRFNGLKQDEMNAVQVRPASIGRKMLLLLGRRPGVRPLGEGHGSGGVAGICERDWRGALDLLLLSAQRRISPFSRAHKH